MRLHSRTYSSLYLDVLELEYHAVLDMSMILRCNHTYLVCICTFTWQKATSHGIDRPFQGPVWYSTCTDSRTHRSSAIPATVLYAVAASGTCQHSWSQHSSLGYNCRGKCGVPLTGHLWKHGCIQIEPTLPVPDAQRLFSKPFYSK